MSLHIAREKEWMGYVVTVPEKGHAFMNKGNKHMRILTTPPYWGGGGRSSKHSLGFWDRVKIRVQMDQTFIISRLKAHQMMSRTNPIAIQP